MSDIDGEGFTDGISGDDAILEVLANSAAVFAVHGNAESSGVIGGLHVESFVDEAAVAGGVQQFDVRWNPAGDIDLEFDGGTSGDGDVSWVNFVQHGDGRNVCVGE
ncbi:MAG UNVERIFIED_CONTAM: hypothetical protein LVR18_07070 [Planctomycetaceae bacterium]